MMRAARALEIACDSPKQKLYHLNQPLQSGMGLLITPFPTPPCHSQATCHEPHTNLTVYEQILA